MSRLELRAGSQDAQEAIGARLAAVCPPALIVYLEGDLGAGKTTLVRGFLRALGCTGPVKSPTYTLMEPYELPSHRCYHLDLYRLADPGELEYLGLRDLFQDELVVLIEWPERGLGVLPEPDLKILIGFDQQGRKLVFEGGGPRAETILAGLGGS